MICKKSNIKQSSDTRKKTFYFQLKGKRCLKSIKLLEACSKWNTNHQCRHHLKLHLWSIIVPYVTVQVNATFVPNQPPEKDRHHQQDQKPLSASIPKTQELILVLFWSRVTQTLVWMKPGNGAQLLQVFQGPSFIQKVMSGFLKPRHSKQCI